jgi:cytochrome c-type biogenesis protein CcmF
MFASFIVLTMIGFVLLLAWRLPLLKSENQLDAVLSRETAFLTQNVLFLVVTFAVLLGTIFPMISEWVTGDKISLNAPYFNRVAGPLMLALLLLMGAAPLLAWRRSAFETLRKNFLIPILAAVVSIPVLFLLGNRTMGGFVGVAALTFVFAGILQEYVRGVRARRQATGEGVGTALMNLVRRNGRRYGGYIVHIGVLLICLGIIGNTFYQEEGQANLRVGESVTVANYTLTYNKMDAIQGPNYTEFAAILDLAKNGQPDGQILAKKNIYAKNAEQPMTEVGLRTGPIEDVYVVLAGFDNMGETAAIKVYINPLMSWMWIGGLVMILGVLISAWPRRTAATAEVRVRAPESVQPVA